MSGIAFLYQKKELLKDLNRLIKALEIYLAEYNYTNTYQKVYDTGCRNIEYEL